MSDSPPSDFELRQALEPFTAEEIARLDRYVELAEQLKSSRFFDQYKQRFEIRTSGQGIEVNLPYDDDEAVTAMAVRLRKLHLEERADAASFPRTVRLLRAHTEGRTNSSADWIRRLLAHYESQVEIA